MEGGGGQGTCVTAASPLAFAISLAALPSADSLALMARLWLLALLTCAQGPGNRHTRRQWGLSSVSTSESAKHKKEIAGLWCFSCSTTDRAYERTSTDSAAQSCGFGYPYLRLHSLHCEGLQLGHHFGVVNRPGDAEESQHPYYSQQLRDKEEARGGKRSFLPAQYAYR